MRKNKKKRLNRICMHYDLLEAIEELRDIVKQLKHNPRFSEIDLQVKLSHAYHHLNYTWNSRFSTIKEYRDLTDANFNKWSKYPSKDITTSHV